MTQNELTPEELCRKILDFAWHGNYFNGVEAFGRDEGNIRATETLNDFEAQLAKLQRPQDGTLMVKGTEHPEERLPFYKPDREKTRQVKDVIRDVLQDFDQFSPCLHKALFDQLLVLYPNIETLDGLRTRLSELEKTLNDREADLIKAKSEERERIAKILTTTDKLDCWLCGNEFVVEVKGRVSNTVQCMHCGTYRCPECNKCYCDLGKQAQRVIDIDWKICREKLRQALKP